MKQLATIPVKANAEFVDSLNAVELEEEEIVEAISATLEAADSGECNLRSVTTPIYLFPTAPQKARAVIFRLQALAMMMERNELKNWMQPGGAAFTPAGQMAVIAAVNQHLRHSSGDLSYSFIPPYQLGRQICHHAEASRMGWRDRSRQSRQSRLD
jgi:hypothetical protein